MAQPAASDPLGTGAVDVGGPGPVSVAPDPFGSIIELKMAEIHRVYATRLLKKHNGNATAAAKVADVDAKTIKRWARGKAR